MQDGLESLAVSAGSAKTEVAQASTVECSAGIEHLRPNASTTRAKRRLAGCDDLARDLVGVDDRHATRREEFATTVLLPLAMPPVSPMRRGCVAGRVCILSPRSVLTECRYRSTSSGPHNKAIQPAAARNGPNGIGDLASVPSQRDERDADDRAGDGREQDDQQQHLPSEPCAERREQFEVAVSHALPCR